MELRRLARICHHRSSRILRNIRSYFDGNMIAVSGHFNVSVIRRKQNLLLKQVIVPLKCRSVINVGSMPNSGDKEGCYYKEYFKKAEYFTLDYNREIVANNHIHCDLHDLSSVGRKFELIMIMNVLEHVEDPFKVVAELKRILEPKGYICVCVPYFYPKHSDEQGRFGDYWRFTDEGLRKLFSRYREVEMVRLPSVIRRVRDRNKYWDETFTATGYFALFQND